MDHSWYEILAESEYNGSQWTLSPARAELSTKEKLTHALEAILRAMITAVDIYNHHSPSHCHITLLQNRETSFFELTLLRFGVKLQLKQQGENLGITLDQTQNYSQEPLTLLLSKKEDEFGNFMWFTPTCYIGDAEQLVKCLLKELVKNSSPLNHITERNSFGNSFSESKTSAYSR